MKRYKSSTQGRLEGIRFAMSSEKPSTVDVYVRKPNGRRKKYSLVVREYDSNGKRLRDWTYKSSKIDSINEAYLSETLSVVKTEAALGIVKNEILRGFGLSTEKPLNHKDNEKILKKYLKKEYEYRELKDRKAAHQEYERAVRVLGNHSLYTIEPSKLLELFSKAYENVNLRSRYLGKIGTLIKFIGRNDFSMPKIKKKKPKPKYLTESEFEKVMSYVCDPDLELWFRVAYYTGMRQSECLAASVNQFYPKKNAIYVEYQLKENEYREPKSVERMAFIFPNAITTYKKWIKVSGEKDFNCSTASKNLKNACIKAFPNNPRKHMTFNGLRHSYAINLLGRGVSISLIAKFLGNNVKVCEDYYLGFDVSNDAIKLVNSLIS